MLTLGRAKNVDFIKDASDLKAVARSVCAFLNSDGGRVLIGADESGHVLGVVDADAESREILAFLNRTITPTGIWSVSVERIPEGNVISVDVPAGAEKPYVVEGAIYLRHEKESVPATGGEIRGLITNREAAERRWERQPALGVELGDLDLEEVLRTARLAEKSGRRDFATEGSDPKLILESLSLLFEGQITNAAYVLFGRKPANLYPQLRVRATIYESDKSGSAFIKDQLYEGHIFSLFDQASEFLKKSIDISSEFSDFQWTRRDKPSYPFWALREGLINALIHRDFSSFSGGVTLGVYPRKVEIWNYGRIPSALKPSDLKKPHPSLPPNPDIAQVCFLRELIEKLGRGTDKIVIECKSAGLRVPVWQTGPSGTTLTFFGKRGPTHARDLNERQRNLIRNLSPGKRFTLNDYMKIIGGTISDRTARNDLSGLVGAALIEKRGKGKNTVYVLKSTPAE